MKTRNHRTGRWPGLAVLALAVAAFVVPSAGALPLGGLPCAPNCKLQEEGQQVGGAPLAGGPSIAELERRRGGTSESTLPTMAELEQFSFKGPAPVEVAAHETPIFGWNGFGQITAEPSRPDDQPGLRGPGATEPLQPLYPVTAPLSGPAEVPTDVTPVTVEVPSGGTNWPMIAVGAGLGALLLVAAMVIGASRRRRTLAHA